MLCIFIGVYPKPFLEKLAVPVAAIVERVSPDRAQTAEMPVLPAEILELESGLDSVAPVPSDD